jgi:hypothetical protein
MVSHCDDVFDKLLNKAATLLESMDKTTFMTIDGKQHLATLESIQNGQGHFVFTVGASEEKEHSNQQQH